MLVFAALVAASKSSSQLSGGAAAALTIGIIVFVGVVILFSIISSVRRAKRRTEQLTAVIQQRFQVQAAPGAVTAYSYPGSAESVAPALIAFGGAQGAFDLANVIRQLVVQRLQGGLLAGSTFTTAAAPADPRAGVAEIVAHDPTFSEPAFLSQAEQAFLLVQRALGEQRPEVARRVMADVLFQELRGEVEERKAKGWRLHIDNLGISRSFVKAANSDAAYDTIVVGIISTSARYDTDASGAVVQGTATPRTLVEDWTFQRSAQAQTKVGGGTLSAQCPNCSAPLEVDETGSCQYCRRAVMGGAYDWVLVRVEQLQHT
jgi:predicted lipid-binding transport protein (Tim44 family)